MKNILAFVVVLLLSSSGCSSQKIMSYMEEPETLLKDPHYEGYKQDLNNLEKDYLDKKIEYAKYLEKRKEIEEKYSKEVQTREAIIRGEQ